MGDVIKPLSIKAAAARLGRSEVWTRDLVKTGKLSPVVRTPLRLAVRDVEQLRQRQHDAAVAELAGRGVDLVKLARDVRREVRPEAMDPVSGGEAAIARLAPRVRDLFGPACLSALTLSDRDECCWCAARVAAQLFKTPAPAYGEVMLALLGDPCPADMKRFADAELTKLRARVWPGGTRPSGARTAPSAAARPGRLACGHLLASGCACPRRASTRGRR